MPTPLARAGLVCLTPMPVGTEWLQKLSLTTTSLLRILFRILIAAAIGALLLMGAKIERTPFDTH